MRTLKLQVQISVDGYIAGLNGEMNWMVWDWDDALKQYVSDLTAPVDCIVLGRNLAEGFIPHWAAVAADPESPDVKAGKKFTNTHKVVFSKTLEESKWENTILAKGNLGIEINKLKNQDGSNIIAYGGAVFVSSLIKNRLIDEYHLLVNPTIIGTGILIYNELLEKQDLKLVQSKAFDCGVVLLHYKLK
jgi:dihydrofolate reductase